MDFITQTLDSLIQQWARRIKYNVLFLCPSCSKKKMLKDCFKGMSLKCGLHNINTAAIKYKFGRSIRIGTPPKTIFALYWNKSPTQQTDGAIIKYPLVSWRVFEWGKCKIITFSIWVDWWKMQTKMQKVYLVIHNTCYWLTPEWWQLIHESLTPAS